MALRLVLGRSGSGKTALCLREVRERLAADPEGPPLILLVPEQATFQTEYALLQQGGLAGSVRAQALSFRRLAFRVMQETGGTSLIPISDNGKQMLLFKIVHRLEGELRLFGGGAEQPGFIERLSELLTEWKRYGIDAASVAEKTEGGTALADSPLLAHKLHDLRLVYEKLERELDGLYVDSEDYLSWLSSGFRSAPSMAGAELWVDGFHGFTPKEYEALAALIASGANITVTLTLDRPYAAGEAPHELDLFHPTAETYGKLLDIASSTGMEVLEPVVLDESPPARFKDNAMLAHLERHYGGRVPMIIPDAKQFELADSRCGLSLHAAPSRRAEVEAAARDMLRRAREEGLRWRDMAIMVRNAGDYDEYIESVLTDFGIPHFLDQKNRAVHHPLVEFIRSAFETVLHGWHYEAVFRCIKTELLFPLDGSLTREAFDLLENYVLAAGIDGWKWLDKSKWRPLVKESLEEGEGIAEPGERSLRELDAVLATREYIVPPLRRFGQALRKAENVREMCEALYRLLDHADAADRLERWSRLHSAEGDARRARAHRQLWDGVMQLLDQLVEMVGGETVTPELFAGMLETGLESLKLAAVPPSVDQVLVGSMDRTRAGRIKVSYVLGANDGVMPMRVKEDGILTEEERERLGEEGLAMAPGVRRKLLDERFMIYNTLTKPERHLWISWTQADEEGKALLPSEVVRQTKRLFPGIPVYAAAAEPAPDMPEAEQRQYIVHPGQTLGYLIAELRAAQQGKAIAPLWWDVYNWFAVRPDWQSRLQLLTASLRYTNEAEPLTPDTARLLYGDTLRASVSRMERFVACPFQHFAIHGLKLRERQLYRLEAPDVGQLFHAALSKLAQGLGPRLGSMSQSEIRSAAAKTVDELAPRLQSQILLSSGRFKYIARKLKEIVSQTAVILGEHARRAKFEPIGLEVAFGPDGELPSLVVPMPNGDTMEIIGRIDRVDGAETEEGLLLRVLDYKSSPTQLRLEEVAFGLSLQMLTYLDVLLTHAESWLGKPALPAGVLYFHVHNPLLSLSNGVSPAEAGGLILKKFKTRGLIRADGETARLMDGELDSGHSELIPVALKRDGTFYSSSSVATDEQWDVLRSSVRRTIGRIGADISQGKVEISPYRLGGKSPCEYCDYKAVCQFDPLFDGNEFKKLRKPPKERLWESFREGGDADDQPADE
ncbi:helicase-exonuclease AddAB subunit AddB [Paenibacillus thailandensis]|uniref:ATP-dependent helicase/deoxyribonuclease subunit B n=1 Tax=Paenibacillus thailandensis TaxID=393250 RepID=A0ABW5QZ37_9BACL